MLILIGRKIVVFIKNIKKSKLKRIEDLKLIFSKHI